MEDDETTNTDDPTTEGNPTGTSTGTDSTETGSGSTSKVTDDKPTGSDSGTTRTFTQEDVNRIMGETRKETVGRTLKKLGFEDFDSLEEAITQYNDHRQSQMSELEQLQEKVNTLQGSTEKLEQYEERVNELTKLVETQLEAQKERLEIPKHVEPLLQTMSPEQQLAYLSEHGESFVKEQPKVPQTNASGKGSGSNNGQDRMKRVRAKYNIR